MTEAAVVGYPHQVKGQGVFAYVTLKEGIAETETLRREIIGWVRARIGPIASPDIIQWSPALPKNRAGKILRRILTKVAANDFQDFGDVSTLAHAFRRRGHCQAPPAGPRTQGNKPSTPSASTNASSRRRPALDARSVAMAERMLRPETLAAQTLPGWTQGPAGAIIPPIHPSTTYSGTPISAIPAEPVTRGRNNPTYASPPIRSPPSKAAPTALFASGMAAATAVFQALEPGDHVLAPSVMYWALRSWLLGFATRWGLDVELVDASDLAAVKAALRPGKTRLIWLETPANPLWTVRTSRQSPN